MLDDGTYDAFVVDVEDDGGSVRIELAITAGERKGEVVALRGDHLAGDPVQLIGLPATLVVEGGTPRFHVDR